MLGKILSQKWVVKKLNIDKLLLDMIFTNQLHNLHFYCEFVVNADV